MPRSLVLVALLLLLSTSFAADKKRDFHLDQDAARDLYLHSAFAHGLRHGYEEGFHAADLDIHTAAPRKALDKLSRVPKTVGYRREFGDKKSFRRGYEYGYVAGYQDSFENRKFHYLSASDVTPLESANRDFDIGVASGYSAVFDSDADDFRCDRDAPAYCAGFQTGSALALAERHTSEHEVASGGAPKR
jgi:peptidoglycan/xylan/chitin deacetylase (PgdA/CDA1 family)